MWSVLTDGAGKIEPIPAPWEAYHGGVSPDGRTLYYSAYQSNQVQEDLMSVALGCGREARGAARDTRGGGVADTITRRPMARGSDECVRHSRDARRTTHGSDRIRAGLQPWRQSHSLES